MNKEEILNKIESVCTPALDELGYELIEWEYTNEQGRWIIRLYIDKDGGVSIDDCERASRSLEDLVDVELDIKHAYSLEVSSPGIYRPLRRKQDFEKFKGATIKLKTKYPLDGRSNYKGVIEDVSEDAVSMVVDGMRYKIPFESLAKANLTEDFSELTAKGREQS